MWLPSLLAPRPSPVDPLAHPATAHPIARRRVLLTLATLVAGTVLLAFTLHARQGSTAFVVLGVATAAAWVLGALAAAPVPLLPDRARSGRIVVQAAALGVASFAVFAAAYQATKHVPVLSGALHSVLGKADAAPRPVVLAVTLVNGLAEEVFFRGALLAGLAVRRPAVVAGLLYVAATAATGNLALVIAAVVMGTIFVRERLTSGGVLAPIVTHLTWSTLMLLALPR